MANITKKIMREITIITVHGDSFTISDDEDCSPASLAVAEFRRGGVMSFTSEGFEYLVPASSVDSIKIEVLSDSE